MPDAVCQKHASRLECATVRQLEVNLAGHAMECRNAVSEQYRMHVEAQLVDEVRLEKRPGEVAASHQTDVLARLLLELPHERRSVAPDQRHAGTRRLFHGAR